MKFGVKLSSRSAYGFFSKFQGLINPKTKGFRVGPLLFWWKKK